MANMLIFQVEALQYRALFSRRLERIAATLFRYWHSNFERVDHMQMTTMLIVFTGKGQQIGYAEGFVSSAADGVILECNVPGIPDATLSAPCKTARFETVVMARNNRTVETGRVLFPEIDSYLDIFTPDTGLIVGVDESKEIGSITWHIRGGGGIFAGATGVVTGNFVAYPDGTFLDHHIYRIVQS